MNWIAWVDHNAYPKTNSAPHAGVGRIPCVVFCRCIARVRQGRAACATFRNYAGRWEMRSLRCAWPVWTGASLRTLLDQASVEWAVGGKGFTVEVLTRSVGDDRALRVR